MNSVKSGAGLDDIYKPSLWYFDELAFLRDKELQQDGVSSLDDGDEDGNEGSIDNIDSSTSGTESQYILISQREKKMDMESKHYEAPSLACAHLQQSNDSLDTLARSWAQEFRN
ncbi:hypothetical protein SK128_027009, partial [Halocaridina rubra]